MPSLHVTGRILPCSPNRKKTALLRIFSLTHLTECRRQVGNIADSYLGGPYFKSLSEDWKVLLMAFVIYLSIFRQISITQICVVQMLKECSEKLYEMKLEQKPSVLRLLVKKKKKVENIIQHTS